jgi:hypothetical protein
VNHLNKNQSSLARAMYYSSVLSRWVHGEREWVHAPQNSWRVTIINLPNGTLYRPGTYETSTHIEVAT